MVVNRKTKSQTDTPIQGSEFEVEVKTSLCKLTKAFFGDKKTKSVGLIKRVEIKVWFVMFKTFEDTLHPDSAASAGSVPASSAGEDQVASLQKKVAALTESNEVLAGYAS